MVLKHVHFVKQICQEKKHSLIYRRQIIVIVLQMFFKTTKIGPDKNNVVENTYLELIIFRLFSVFSVVIHYFPQVSLGPIRISFLYIK